MKHQKKPSKLKKVLAVIGSILLILAVCAGALWLSMDYHAKHYNITFYQLTSDKINENLRVVFISDLHLREYGEDNSVLIEDIQSLKPGLILLGGDMVLNTEPAYDNMLSLCSRLAQIAPVYAVTGNHEDELIYHGGAGDLIERFAECGVSFLRNRDVTLEIGTNTVQLVGLNGGVAGYDKYGAADEIAGLSVNGSVYRILLDHVPAAFSEKLSDAEYDLGLAGHVHGGIIRLPKLGGVYSSEEGLFPEYDRGLYTMASGAVLIVGAGLGDSLPIPLRINNDPELVVVDINWY